MIRKKNLCCIFQIDTTESVTKYGDKKNQKVSTTFKRWVFNLKNDRNV